MTDTVQGVGTFDPMSAGFVIFENRSAVLTVSKDYLAAGWPVWAYRYSNPLDDKFTKSLADMVGGSANIYNGNPVPFVVPGGVLDVGNQGSITLLTKYLGTFDDFAVYAAAGQDPAVNGWIHPSSPNSVNSPTGTISTAWAEASAMVFPPKNARFVVPEVNVTNIPASMSVYLDSFDTRVVPYNEDPTIKPSYQAPRNLIAKVKPTRLNLTTSPDFTQNTVNVGLSIAADTSQAYGIHTRSGKVTVSATTCTSKETQDTIEVLPEEGLWVTQRYYTPTDLTGTYYIAVDFLTEAGVPVSTVLSTDTMHTHTGDGWAEVTFFSAVPAGATKARVWRVYSQGAGHSGDAFWLDYSLIERSSAKGDFFDGSFANLTNPADPDYLWQSGGTAFACWSYYYQDRAARNYILTRLLQENVPLGMTVASPQYATYTGE